MSDRRTTRNVPAGQSFEATNRREREHLNPITSKGAPIVDQDYRVRSPVALANWPAPPAADHAPGPRMGCGLSVRPNRSLKAGELPVTLPDGSRAWAPECELTPRLAR